MAQRSGEGNRVVSADPLEARARRTPFGQRTAKITGKVSLASVTGGRWSTPKTPGAQLAAEAAHRDVPVTLTPEAWPQRLTARAAAFLHESVQGAFAELHTGNPICDDGLWAPFGAGHIADSTGLGLPESRQKGCPGAGGRGSKAGAKMHLVWEYKSQPSAPCALESGNVPATT